MSAVPKKQWKIDHVGHAVADLRAATAQYVESCGFTVDCKETLAEQRIEIVFLKSGDFLIELLAPLPGETVLQKFLSKRGPGLHHICYRVESVSGELALLRAAGVRLIDESPRIGSRNLHVAFLHPSSCSGALVELCGNA